MSPSLAYRDSPDRLTLLVVQCAEDLQNSTYAFEQSSLKGKPSYEVLEYMRMGKQLTSLIKIEDQDVSIDMNLANALFHLREKGKVRKFWIDDLCPSLQDASKKESLAGWKKRIRTGAQRVLIWIGNHHEDEDTLTGYLEEGSSASTKDAFEFAREMAAVDYSRPSLSKVMDSTAPHKQTPKWCDLARLLYRPWFRELPLLRTNYLAELPFVTVVCGAEVIGWSEVCITAERVRVLQPIPHLILEDCQKSFFPGMSTEKGIKWLQAREKFGFSSAKLFAQITCVLQKMEKDSSAENIPQRDRFVALIGVLDVHVISTTISECKRAMVREEGDKIRAETKDPTSSATTTLVPSSPIPSLPFQGWLSSPPDVMYQAPFVHTPAFHGLEIRMLKLLPHMGDRNSPLQCGLFHDSFDNPLPYTYVLNATLKDYRLTSLILVNGQAFRVPSAIAVFLQQIRDADAERSLYIWKVCNDPDKTSIQWRGALEYYTRVKRFIMGKASSTTDMYTVLDKISDYDLKSLSEGTTTDDWLLDLMDEEEINDLPYTEENLEEDRERDDVTKRLQGIEDDSSDEDTIEKLISAGQDSSTLVE